MVEPTLTPIQQKFVETYLQTSNGTQSAIAAGYSQGSASAQASRLLKKPRIKQYLLKRLKATELNKEKVVEEIRELSRDDKVRTADRLAAYNLIVRLMGWLQENQTNVQVNLLSSWQEERTKRAVTPNNG